MLVTTHQERSRTLARESATQKLPSPGLQWLWQQLRDVPNPLILDCGALRRVNVNVLLARGAKLFLADLVAPAQRANPKYWDRSGKVPIFLTDVFLGQLPAIPPGSLHAVFSWHLLDVIPSVAVAPTVERLYSYLQPGGVLFCLLRQPYLPTGAETAFSLDGLNAFDGNPKAHEPFPYPVVTNREMERLLPTGSVKIFLTRSGRREVVALK
jgi:hypothetical protein